MKPAIFPFVIACLVYGDTFSNNIHHTPVVVDMLKIKSSIPTRAGGAIFVDEGRVPFSNLEIVRSPFGAGRAD
jgi:hypothetical protein